SFSESVSWGSRDACQHRSAQPEPQPSLSRQSPAKPPWGTAPGVIPAIGSAGAPAGIAGGSRSSARAPAVRTKAAARNSVMRRLMASGGQGEREREVRDQVVEVLAADRDTDEAAALGVRVDEREHVAEADSDVA